MASETTYSDDFVKHPFGPAASRRPTQLTTQTGVLQKETTYNTSYWDKSKQMQPRVKMQPEKHGSGAKFSGQSLYSVEFTNPGRQPPSKVVRHGDSLGSHGAKFDSDSTYHDDYRQWKIPAKHLHRRPDNPQPTGKIEGPTTYQADYQNRKIPNQCPVSVGSKPSIVCGDHMCYWVHSIAVRGSLTQTLFREFPACDRSIDQWNKAKVLQNTWLALKQTTLEYLPTFIIFRLRWFIYVDSSFLLKIRWPGVMYWYSIGSQINMLKPKNFDKAIILTRF